MVTGRQVQAALYDFMQVAFGGDAPANPQPERMNEVADLLRAHRSLRAESVAQWPVETRRAAYDLFSRLLMLVSLFEDLPFPAGFLDGSSPRRLGEPVLVYILERQHQLLALGQSSDGP